MSVNIKFLETGHYYVTEKGTYFKVLGKNRSNWDAYDCATIGRRFYDRVVVNMNTMSAVHESTEEAFNLRKTLRTV